MKRIILIIGSCMCAFTALAQVRVGENGNVGIGTNSPLNQLHVNGNSYFQNGNIGVGVLTPYEKIHVDGNMFLTNNKSIWIGNNADNGYRLRLHSSNNSNAYIDYYRNLYFRSGYSSATNNMILTYDGELLLRGEFVAHSTSVTSDIRLKENFGKVSNSLNKLISLDAVTYTLKDEYSKFAKGKKPTAQWLQEHKDDTSRTEKVKLPKHLKGKTQIGFSAQEVQKVFPELVKENEFGYLSLNYIGLIPVLVEALKEQETKIENLEKELKLTNKGKSNDTDTEKPTYSNFLFQTATNLYSENTVIKYNLAQTATDAQLCIYDMNGSLLKSFTISQTGDGSITLAGKELNAGMYLYALIANGQLIDTKTMVLTY